jgi:hypothetical protein
LEQVFVTFLVRKLIHTVIVLSRCIDIGPGCNDEGNKLLSSTTDRSNQWAAKAGCFLALFREILWVKRVIDTRALLEEKSRKLIILRTQRTLKARAWKVSKFLSVLRCCYDLLTVMTFRSIYIGPLRNQVFDDTHTAA